MAMLDELNALVKALRAGKAGKLPAGTAAGDAHLGRGAINRANVLPGVTDTSSGATLYGQGSRPFTAQGPNLGPYGPGRVPHSSTSDDIASALMRSDPLASVGGGVRGFPRTTIRPGMTPGGAGLGVLGLPAILGYHQEESKDPVMGYGGLPNFDDTIVKEPNHVGDEVMTRVPQEHEDEAIIREPPRVKGPLPSQDNPYEAPSHMHERPEISPHVTSLSEPPVHEEPVIAPHEQVPPVVSHEPIPLPRPRPSPQSRQPVVPVAHRQPVRQSAPMRVENQNILEALLGHPVYRDTQGGDAGSGPYQGIVNPILNR